MKTHTRFRDIKSNFTDERKARIEEGTEELRTELRILSEVRKAAGYTQEELADILEVRQSHISQVESRENVTLSTLVGIITAMGGSIDITVNFPERKSIRFSQIETLIANKRKEGRQEF
jgi:transcriptional regulator with XRE-family HTH domain